MMPCRIGLMVVGVLAASTATAACGKQQQQQPGGEASPAPEPVALGVAPSRVLVGACGGGEAAYESGLAAPRAQWGTIGTGRYGTIGHGSGSGSGYGVGTGVGVGRSTAGPRVRIGNAVVGGDLDKNIIRRYIRRQMPRITYCYEKRLLVRAELAGTVVVDFQIDAGGKVITAKASGIGDADLESCVADAIKAIEFPKPSGGGIVAVKYPFKFSNETGEVGAGLAAAPDAAPPPPPPPELLAGREAEIGACLAKQPAAWGVAVLELELDGQGKVTAARTLGLADATAGACLVELGRGLGGAVSPPARLRCPIVWGSMSTAELPAIDVDDKTDADALHEKLAARERERLAVDPAKVPITGPLLVRAQPNVGAELFWRAWSSARAATALQLAPMVLDGGAWRPLQRLELPRLPLERDPPAPTEVAEPRPTLCVLVTGDEIFVGVSRVGEVVMVHSKDGAPDLEALAKTLATFKSSPMFADRADAELSFEAPVVYGALVPVAAALDKAGFTDFELVEPESMSMRFKY